MNCRHGLYLLLVGTQLSFAEPRYSQNDFGGVGLLQTPTARMAPAGEISINANRTDPYSRYSFSLQPFDWMEGTFRYTSISNRKYGAEDFSGDQSYKDKASTSNSTSCRRAAGLPRSLWAAAISAAPACFPANTS